MCPACVLLCVGVWSWSALQFALEDPKTALIAMPQVYTHRLYGHVQYTTSVCVSLCHMPIHRPGSWWSGTAGTTEPTGYA